MGDELSLSLVVPTELNPDGAPVRMAGTPDAPLFCLPDLCRVLDGADPSQVAKRLREDELVKGVDSIHPVGGQQKTNFVTEPGLYRILGTSRAEKARTFQDWIYREVVPAIRRYGIYPPPQQRDDPTLALIHQQQSQLQVVERLYIGQMEHAQRLTRVEAVADAALAVSRSNHGYISVLGYARLRRWEMPVENAARHGKRLTAICFGLGCTIGKVRDERFGSVNTYPESVLSEYFAQNEP